MPSINQVSFHQICINGQAGKKQESKLQKQMLFSVVSGMPSPSPSVNAGPAGSPVIDTLSGDEAPSAFSSLGLQSTGVWEMLLVLGPNATTEEGTECRAVDRSHRRTRRSLLGLSGTESRSIWTTNTHEQQAPRSLPGGPRTLTHMPGACIIIWLFSKFMLSPNLIWWSDS